MQNVSKSKVILTVLLSFVLFVYIVQDVYAETEVSLVNRFNVVIVLDASNSLHITDKNGFRYEAISQFVNLLTEEGNNVGGIVFSNHIDVKQDIQLINSQQQKNDLINMLQSFMSTNGLETEGYTNIGEGLLTAVDMLNNDGLKQLPAVIVFLSDGNTAMHTEEDLAISLDMKAEAIQQAREKGIRIYSICLNADNKANTTEMLQISQATGGEFQEVKQAEDLTGVFSTFYGLIYGTSPIVLCDDFFPENGVLETPFEVPGLGVEEVNIVISGNAKNISLFDPQNEAFDIDVFSSQTFRLIKLTDLTAGWWKLVTEGVGGEQIQINMIYNTNLSIGVEMSPDSLSVGPGLPLQFNAFLKSGNVEIYTDEQYIGYSANIEIKNASGDNVQSIPMTVDDGKFVGICNLSEGVYYIDVAVVGHYLQTVSETIGPIIVSQDALLTNSAPVARKNPLKKTVYIWPKKGGSLTLDLTELASDAEDDELIYRLVSSSFLAGSDYTLENNILTMKDFSLSKGSFDISATDSGGLSCNIEIIVVSRNVGIMALIGLMLGALVLLLVFLAICYKMTQNYFCGNMTVSSCVDGKWKRGAITGRKGKCRLVMFNVDEIDSQLDYYKSYFQATRKRYIWLYTNVPVFCNNEKEAKRKMRIESGRQYTITLKQGSNDKLQVRFDSIL